MASQNLTHSSKVLTFCIMLSIMSSVWKTAESFNKDYYKQQRPAAIDAISLSIQEVHEIRNFASKILRLKRLVLAAPPSNLFQCVNDLLVTSFEIQTTLRRMRHLKAPGLLSDTNYLKNSLDHAFASGNICRRPLSYIDGVLPSLLARKLENLALTVEDVVRSISKLEYGRQLAIDAEKYH